MKKAALFCDAHPERLAIERIIIRRSSMPAPIRKDLCEECQAPFNALVGAPVSVTPAPRGQTRSIIAQALRAAGGPQTALQIRQQTGLDVSRLYPALTAMVAERELRAKGKRKTRAYSLPA